jgi:excisionase family DNA binding protein
VTRIEFPEVMGIAQASAYLDCSEDKLYEYVRDGDVPGFKLGNRWKFRKARLDEWMDRKVAQRQFPGGAT